MHVSKEAYSCGKRDLCEEKEPCYLLSSTTAALLHLAPHPSKETCLYSKRDLSIRQKSPRVDTREPGYYYRSTPARCPVSLLPGRRGCMAKAWVEARV